MELKHITVPISEAKLLGDGQTLTGYGSTFGNTDRQSEVVDKGAFTKTLPQWRRDGFVAWQHNWDVPIAYPTKATEDDKGLYFEAAFHSTPDAQVARTITAERLAASKSMGLSIGYEATVWEYDKPEQVRHLKEITLYEVSLVTVPANPKATVTGLKTVVPFQDLPLAGREVAWDATAADGRVREWAGASEEPNGRYARAFLWFDDSAPDNFGSYKLGYADVVDGKLTAIPRGLFACAGVMQGARGGADIPAADQTRIKANLERWYSKMADAFDDEEITPPWKSLAAFTGHREFMAALVAEAEALHGRRSKEGRELSSANVAKLRSIAEQLSGASDILLSLLDGKGLEGPTPAELEARIRRLRLAV